MMDLYNILHARYIELRARRREYLRSIGILTFDDAPGDDTT
jgi:hypothetical protein